MADMKKAMQELDELFSAARETPAPMPDHLMSAILADAVAVRAEVTQPASEVAQPAPEVQPQARSSMWRQLIMVIGGGPALGGLAAACAVGVWIGIAPPSFLPDPAQLIGYSDNSSVPYDSYDLAMQLGEEVQ